MIPGEAPDALRGLSDAPDPTRALGGIIERELGGLRRGVEVLVWRMGLARGRDEVAATADDVLQDVVVRALGRASDFDVRRSAHAWLYGIAVNVVRERRRHRLVEDRRRAEAVVERAADRSEGLDRETFDAVTTGLGEALVELLDLVSPADQELLRYAFVEDLRGPGLAAALGIKEGAARVRLSRALSRLAAAYRLAEEAGRRG